MSSNLSQDVLSRVLSRIKDPKYLPDGDAALFGRLNRKNRKVQFVSHGEIHEAQMLRLGSLTKTLLGYIALKHKIPLDETVYSLMNNLEPSVYASSDTITIRQLMTHTSGVLSYSELPNATKLAEVFTPPVIIDLAWKNRPLVFSPGSHWFYSNTNSEIVASWLMNITQKTPRQLFEEEFHKDGLKSITLDSGEKLDFPMTTTGYRDFNMPHTFPSVSGTLLGTPTDTMLAIDKMAADLEIWKTMKSWANVPRFPDPENPAGGHRYGLFLQEFQFKDGVIGHGHDGHIGVSTIAFEANDYVYLFHATREYKTDVWMEYVNSIMNEVL